MFIYVGNFVCFPGISPYLRKIALRLKLKKVIEQQEDRFIVKTCSTFRNYTIAFRVDQEFQEFTEGLDNRHVKVKMELQANVSEFTVELLFIWLYYSQQSVVTWHGDKLVCEQIGEKRCRGWTHWMEEDKLHLVRQE